MQSVLELVEACISPNPDQRPSASDALAWLRAGG